MKKMRVVLVDDEIMIREGFKKLFNWEEHDCQVVGEASDGMEAMTVIEELLPDIVIMDINIPIMNGLKVIHQNHTHFLHFPASLHGKSRCAVTPPFSFSAYHNPYFCPHSNLILFCTFKIPILFPSSFAM